ncbi:MAG: nudix (nucleoside diphosphate linked moiety X)-type motif 2 [Marteilia pararefringens]
MIATTQAASKKHICGGIVIFKHCKEIGLKKFLMLQAPGHLTWGFPKGHVEESDSGLLSAALRETLEETGLRNEEHYKLVLPDKLHFDSEYVMPNGQEKLVQYFFGELNPEVEFDKVFRLSEEHIGFRWMSSDECKALGLYQATQDVFKFAEANLKEVCDSK